MTALECCVGNEESGMSTRRGCRLRAVNGNSARRCPPPPPVPEGRCISLFCRRERERETPRFERSRVHQIGPGPRISASIGAERIGRPTFGRGIGISGTPAWGGGAVRVEEGGGWSA